MREALSQNWDLKDELSFDVNRKLASYIYRYGKSPVVLSSGAPEKLRANSYPHPVQRRRNSVQRCQSNRSPGHVALMAQSGERLLAFGYRRLPTDSAKENLERDIVFVGILGFIDPPRKEVRGAITNLPRKQESKS